MSGIPRMRCARIVVPPAEVVLGIGMGLLAASRLPAGGGVRAGGAARATLVLVGVVTANSSVRSFASHELEPLPPAPTEMVRWPGHTHSRRAPVASEKT